MFRSLLGLLSCTSLIINSVQISQSNNSLLSHVNIHSLLQIESDILSNARNYFIHERNQLKDLQMYLHDWKTWKDSYNNKKNEYITVPQNLVHLFKRLTVDLEKLGKPLMENDFLGKFPDSLISDYLKQVTISLVHLQHQYDLKPRDLINGTLMDLRLNTSLSFDSCYFIGKTCAELGDHVCTIDWLSACLSSTLHQPDQLKIYGLLYPAYLFLNQSENAFRYASKYNDHHTYDASSYNIRIELGYALGLYTDTMLKANHICRGDYERPRANLKCTYNHQTSAFLKIAPLKEEELNYSPKILLYHDVLYDSEIQVLKEKATQQMEITAMPTKDGDSKVLGFNYRISEKTRIDHKTPSFIKLTQRIEDISDLSLEASERWQVINYSPGGFFVLHSDYLFQEDVDEILGNRETTLLFYFNSVLLGGETVFPRVSLSVAPIKGAVLIWHNVLADGSKNDLVDHNACPVVIGEKWGFTQWILSRNQKCLRRVYQYNVGN